MMGDGINLFTCYIKDRKLSLFFLIFLTRSIWAILIHEKMIYLVDSVRNCGNEWMNNIDPYPSTNSTNKLGNRKEILELII